MGTRSRIGMLLPDGRVRSIYCHWDGYPSGAGRTLQDWWGESVIPLLNLGDLSVLGAEPGQDQGPGVFDARRELADDDPRRAWCVAYGRDRGEQGTEALTHPKGNWPDSGQEYEYLWTGKAWMVRAKYAKPRRWTALLTVLDAESVAADAETAS